MSAGPTGGPTVGPTDGPARRFAGRRALVTGASRGIGAGVAERLAAEGAAVVVTARTRTAHDHLAGSLEEVRARIAGRGGEVAVVVADLSDEADRARIVPEASDALGGPVDILVNNAAAAMYAPTASMTARRRRLLFEVNVHAPADLAQAVIPAMVDAGAGWIVNVVSAAARAVGGPPFDLGPHAATIATYGASKAALARLSNGLGAELYGTGVRVNAVAPRAAVRSEGAAAILGDALDDARFEPLEAMVEAVVALCCCDADLTARDVVSLDLLDELGLPVRPIDGTG